MLLVRSESVEVVLASPFALLRDFSAGDEDVVPTLLFPPLAGHASCIIDKNGQSQVQLCITTGLTRVYSFDWLSCTGATKDTTEADRLDFITRAADLIAGPGARSTSPATARVAGRPRCGRPCTPSTSTRSSWPARRSTPAPGMARPRS